MTRSLTLSALALLLAGCGTLPDLREMRRLDRAFALPDPAPEVVGPSAGAIEGACADAGRAAGFEVLGIAGSSEVADAAGVPVSRDVMLRARRGGQSFEVRCNYAFATGTARMMTL